MLVTEEQVRDTAEELNITWWKLRSCSICGTPVGYVMRDDAVFYDGDCECTSGLSQMRPSSYSDLAQTFNRQTPEAAEKLWRSFKEAGKA